MLQCSQIKSCQINKDIAVARIPIQINKWFCILVLNGGPYASTGHHFSSAACILRTCQALQHRIQIMYRIRDKDRKKICNDKLYRISCNYPEKHYVANKILDFATRGLISDYAHRLCV